MTIQRCEKCERYGVVCESDSCGRQQMNLRTGEQDYVLTLIEDCQFRPDGSMTRLEYVVANLNNFHHPDAADDLLNNWSSSSVS